MKITDVEVQKTHDKNVYVLLLTTDAEVNTGTGGVPKFYTQRVLWNKNTPASKPLERANKGYQELLAKLAELEEVRQTILLAKK